MKFWELSKTISVRDQHHAKAHRISFEMNLWKSHRAKEKLAKQVRGVVCPGPHWNHVRIKVYLGLELW